MGVHGLWKLLQPTGKPVPVETLENKVLAVDVSIWLHQTARGFQDARGQALPNAHLLGLFHRLCKLLFWRVRPVFVFDGGAPLLKQHTVAARRQRNTEAADRAERARRKLIGLRLQRRALQEVMAARGGSAPSPPAPTAAPPPPPLVGPDQMFVLPELPPKQSSNRSGEEEESSADEDWAGESVTGDHMAGSAPDLHSVDVHSAEFRALPANVRHDILSELKETRKQSSWGRLHEMPREFGAFSNYQMQRLLKRRSVQESLEAAEKEMGGRTLSLAEMEELMRDKGALDTAMAAAPGQRIAADTYTRFILLSDCATTASKAKPPGNGEQETENPESKCIDLNTEEKATSLSEIFISDGDSSNDASEKGLPNVERDENSELDEFTKKQLQAAQNFMFENSGLTQEQILAVIKSQNTVQDRPKLSVGELSTSNAAFRDSMSSNEFQEPEKMHEATENHSTNLFSEPSMNKLSENSLVVQTIFENRKTQNTDFHEPGAYVKRQAANKDLVEDSCFGILREDSCQFKNKEAGAISSINISTELISDNSLVKTSENLIHKFDTNSVSEMSSHLPSTAVVSSINSYVGNSPKQENRGALSSDDDFIEVEELLKPVVPLPIKSSKASLQVVVESNLSDLGEDIFADVFENISKPISQQQEGSLHCKPSLSVVTKQQVAKRSLKLTTQQQETVKDPEEQMRKITQSPIKSKPVAAEKKIHLLEQIDEVEMEESGSSQEDMQNESAPMLTLDELQMLQDTLSAEGVHIQKQQVREERLAVTINDQMIQEAQELLQLFGVPYIVAPMEAEAQCAFLDRACLTDGTITDDSDIWLFGGQKVYKNFFDQKKHVLQFRDIDIQQCFKLTRVQMILLALLVGSDYTTGLPGVGPVTALEILAAFPANLKAGPPDQLLEGLHSFRDWCSCGMDFGQGHAKLRAKLKDLQLTREFPSKAVVEAYMSPKVDESMEKFSWGIPDVDSIKEFARIKFGWSGEKTQEILQPILKKLNIKITQPSIDSYFQAKPRLPLAEGSLSKRVQRAVNRLDSNAEDSSEEEVIPSKRVKPEFASVFHERARKRGRGTISARGSSRGPGRATDAQVNLENPAQEAKASTSTASASSSSSATKNVTGKEFILQREKDKLNLLRNKLKAIEVFRKTKRGRTKQNRITKKKILKEAKLSESSSSSDQ